MNPYSSTGTIPVAAKRQFRVWIPFLVIWVLLLPFVLLLAPLVFVACLVKGIDPIQGVSVYWELFSSLRGLRVEVEAPGARIRIH
jgi:hypothetical protein